MTSCTINRGLLLLTFLSILFFPVHDRAMAGEVEEYSVKAAFVFNFTKFIQWSETSAVKDSGVYRVCVVGNESVIRQFDSIDGKKNGDLVVQVNPFSSTKEIKICDIIFISRDVDRALSDEIIFKVKGKPILTIGETKGFAKSGGVINLFSKNNRLFFEINPGAANSQGLTLSSRLLKLAIIVDEDK
jgi:hypothetical protein